MTAKYTNNQTAMMALRAAGRKDVEDAKLSSPKKCSIHGEYAGEYCPFTHTGNPVEPKPEPKLSSVEEGEAKEKECSHDSFHGGCASCNPNAPAPANEYFAEPKPTPSARKLEAAKKRLEEGNYKPWGTAGGPNECRHGYAAGIPCQRCDRALVYDSSDMEFLAKLLTEAGAIPVINGVRIEPKSAPSNEEDQLPHRVRIAVDRITAQLGIDTAKDILYVTNELMDVWEHHSLKPQPDSSSIPDHILDAHEMVQRIGWEGIAGSIIDTVHLTPEDYVNEKLVEQLKRYFADSSSIPDEPVVLHQEKRLTQVFACGEAFENAMPKQLVSEEALAAYIDSGSIMARDLRALREWAKGQSNGR